MYIVYINQDNIMYIHVYTLHTQYGESALFRSVEGGNIETVKLLLSRGADPNQIVSLILCRQKYSTCIIMK